MNVYIYINGPLAFPGFVVPSCLLAPQPAVVPGCPTNVSVEVEEGSVTGTTVIPAMAAVNLISAILFCNRIRVMTIAH